jgi:WD40 repeat protein
VKDNWNATLQTLEGHSFGINVVVFSPDSNMIASASLDGTIKLWDTRSGMALLTLYGHMSAVNAVTFSLDSKLLASGSKDGTVKLWDVNLGTELKTPNYHVNSVIGMTFSPDSKLISVSDDSWLTKWDPDRRVSIDAAALVNAVTLVNAAAFSSDGMLLAISMETYILIFNIKARAILQTLIEYTHSISALTFSPECEVLASGSDSGRIQVWDISRGALLRFYQDHDFYRIKDLSFSPDCKLLASASTKGTIDIRTADSGIKLQTLTDDLQLVNTVAFSPDGRLLASGSQNKMIKLWQVELETNLRIPEVDSTNSITGLLFSPNGKLLVSATHPSAVVTLWDVSSGVQLQTLEGERNVETVAFSHDSRLLASRSFYNTIDIWNAELGYKLQTLEGHSDAITTLAFSPNSKLLVSGAKDCLIKQWDIASGAALFRPWSHSSSITAVVFSSNGTLLASTSESRTINLWDTRSRELLHTFLGHSNWVDYVSFSQDSTMLASTSKDFTIKLWSTGSGLLLLSLDQSSFVSYIDTMTFSPDSKILVVASDDKTIRLWDTRLGSLLLTLYVDYRVKRILFSNDGLLLHTDKGAYMCSTVTDSQLHIHPLLLIKKQWISYGTENIVWIPPEHRPIQVAVHGSTVVFGTRSGEISFIEFELEMISKFSNRPIAQLALD